MGQFWIASMIVSQRCGCRKMKKDEDEKMKTEEI